LGDFGFRRRRDGGFWPHWHPGTEALKPVDHDVVTRLQPGSNDTFAVDNRPELYRLVSDRIGRRKRKHIFLSLVGADGPFRDEQGGVAFAEWDTDARKQSGHDAPVAVRKNRAQEDA